MENRESSRTSDLVLPLAVLVILGGGEFEGHTQHGDLSKDQELLHGAGL